MKKLIMIVAVATLALACVEFEYPVYYDDTETDTETDTMINPNLKYPANTKPADSDYPYGSARDVVTEGDGTGTPRTAHTQNDLWGLCFKLLDAAGIVPNNLPETVTLSQCYTALLESEIITDAAISDVSLDKLTFGASGAMDDGDYIMYLETNLLRMIHKADNNQTWVEPNGITEMSAGGNGLLQRIKRLGQDASTDIVSWAQQTSTLWDATGVVSVPGPSQTSVILSAAVTYTDALGANYTSPATGRWIWSVGSSVMQFDNIRILAPAGVTPTGNERLILEIENL